MARKQRYEACNLSSDSTITLERYFTVGLWAKVTVISLFLAILNLFPDIISKHEVPVLDYQAYMTQMSSPLFETAAKLINGLTHTWAAGHV